MKKVFNFKNVLLLLAIVLFSVFMPNNMVRVQADDMDNESLGDPVEVPYEQTQNEIDDSSVSLELQGTLASTSSNVILFTNAGDSEYSEYSLAELAELEDTVNWNMSAKYETAPQLKAPYSAGRLTDDCLNNLRNQINFFRTIAHVDKVELNEQYCTYSQAGSVLNYVSEFSHYPSKPSDMDNYFYQTAYKGTSSSNISWEYGSNAIMNSLISCLDDSDSSNIDRVGHRRWILNPNMGDVGFGCTQEGSGKSIWNMYAIDNSNASGTNADFTAWPGGNKVFPSEYFDTNQAWSIHLKTSTFSIPLKGAVKITLTRESDGKKWTFSGVSDSTTSKKYFNVDTGGYGSSYALIFRPDMDVSEYSGKYTVNVTGLQTTSGQAAQIKYTVDFQELAGVIPVPKKPYKVTNVVSGIHVYWKSVDGAVKYGLWRSDDGKDGTYKWIANSTATHFIDTTVDSGKTYYYKVTAINTANVHTEKSEALGMRFVATPDITTRMNRSTGIGLGWNKIDGATGYAIYRRTYWGTDPWVRVATITNPNTLSWTDTGVKDNNGKTYRYTIRALTGPNRNYLSGCRTTGRTMVRMTTRTFCSVTKVTANSVKCHWMPTKHCDGYEVRFMVGNTVYKTYTVGNYQTGFKTFAGLKAGQTYKVQVRSYKKVNNVGTFYSAWSNEKYISL